MLTETFETDIPARLDRLPWNRFHSLVLAGLGITWVLDGLEVTLVGSLSPAITGQNGLGLSAAQFGITGSAYVLGAVLGALVFGRLADRFGRRKLFTITVGVYLVATIATGFSVDFWSFVLFRFFTGAGIGGEYGAINSAIQELIPARRRGFTDIFLGGTFWIGAALGALASVVVMDPNLFPAWLGWRLAFIVGGMLALVIVFVRRIIPESPRWLITQGRVPEAEAIVQRIEAAVRRRGLNLPDDLPKARVRRRTVGWVDVVRTLARAYPSRTVLGLVLMASQAFCYNAIFFTYALILDRFYHVPAPTIGWFILPFALGNFAGPLILGPLFDSLGRKLMISFTYGLSGCLLCLTGWLFSQGVLTPVTQTVAWTVIFFFASAGAGAAYLTVGECFPLEIRGVTISLFYAVGTLIGGVGGPALFGALIAGGEPVRIFWGYALGGGMMLCGAATAWVLGVAAECRPLEEVAPPLSYEPPGLEPSSECKNVGG